MAAGLRWIGEHALRWGTHVRRVVSTPAVVRVRRAFRVRFQRLTKQRPAVQVVRECLQLGSVYGAHTVCPTGLSASSVVYSAGVGCDASFDTALIERFGLVVHAFDPTEASVAWVRSQSLPPEFRMNAVAVGTYDGVARFFKPATPHFISHSTLPHAGVSRDAVEVPLRCLKTLMQERGHARIDVLKLDIEGAEYEVLEQLCEQQLDVAQILVEFHHHTSGFSYARTKAMLRRLHACGYRVFFVSPSGCEVSLIRD